MKVYRIVRKTHLLDIDAETMGCFKSKYRADTFLDGLKENQNKYEALYTKYSLEVLEVKE